MKYEEPEPGEWVYPIRKGYKLACCDCSLVHRIDFRLTRYAKDKTGRRFIEFRVFRDERATAARRKKKSK